MPAALQPLDAAAGDRGIRIHVQHTTRATPAAINASAQGGVRPV
jgi:hypothetical protein